MYKSEKVKNEHQTLENNIIEQDEIMWTYLIKCFFLISVEDEIDVSGRMCFLYPSTMVTKNQSDYLPALVYLLFFS